MDDDAKQDASAAPATGRDRSLAARIALKLPPSPGVDVFGLWAERVAFLAEASLLDESDRPHFGFEVETLSFHDVNVSKTIVARPQRNRRTESLIIESRVTSILVQFFRSGGFAGTLHERRVAVAAGGIVLIDLAKPFDIAIEASDILAVIVPRATLPPALTDLDLHGIVLAAEAPVTQLIVGHLQGVLGEGAGLTLEEGSLAVRALLLLLEAALSARPRLERSDAPGVEQSLLGRTRGFIEANLGNQNLSIADIANGLRVSRMMLYRLFQDDGGARAYIRERRLLRCHEIIIGNLRRDMSLGAIAFEQGFTSEALFSRSFKQRFGISPSAARKIALKQSRSGLSVAPAPPPDGGMPPVALGPKRR